MKKLFLTSVLLVISGAVYGSTIGFLKDSLLGDFSEAEMREFRQFVAESLETLEDDKVVSWRSTSGAKGRFKAKFTFESDGATCRRSLFLVAKDNRKEKYQFDICKSDGRWAIQRTPVKDFKKSDWSILRESLASALDQPLIGSPFSWHNEKTGNSGSHVVLGDETHGDQQCKRVAITVFNKRGMSSNGVYVLCKSDSGSGWERQPQLQDF